MDSEVTAIFCHVDDFLKELSWKDDPQCRMSTAEIVTTGIVSWKYFSGNFERARSFLKTYRYIPNMLSKSQLSRRFHSIPEHFWSMIASYLANKFPADPHKTFVVDSFPVPVCKIFRSAFRHLFQNKKFCGFNASKKSWFIGLKVHLIARTSGQPIEFMITPGSVHDNKAFQNMYLGCLPQKSVILGDKAYCNQAYEIELEKRGLLLTTDRRSNSKRGNSLVYHRYGRKIRKSIETTFSKISNWLPHHIHAVTNRGFLLKIMLLMAAFSMDFCI